MPLDPPARAAAGRDPRRLDHFDGKDVLALPARELRAIRGAEISMIFQDPMSSLNPVYTIGDQISEPLRMHRGMARRAARAEAGSSWTASAYRLRASGSTRTRTNCRAACGSA